MSIGSELLLLATKIKQSLQGNQAMSCRLFTNVPGEFYKQLQQQLESPTCTITSYTTFATLEQIAIPEEETPTVYYVIHWLNQGSNPLAILPLSKWIQDHIAVCKGLQHIYLIQHGASNTSPLFAIAEYMFRTMSIRAVPPAIYDLSYTDPLSRKCLVPNAMVKTLLFENVNIQGQSYRSGMESICETIDRTQEWSDLFRNVSASVVQNYATVVLESNPKAASELSLQQNMMFYDELLKHVVWSYTIPMEEIPIYERGPFLSRNLFTSCVSYFKEFCTMFSDITRQLIELRKDPRQEYYVPHMYQFNPFFWQYISKNSPISFDHTPEWEDFTKKDLLVKTNIIGRALTVVLDEFATRDRFSTATLLCNEFIKNHMKKISTKTISFIPPTCERSTMIGTLKEVLENDFFSSMGYLQTGQVQQLVSFFTKEEQVAFGPALDEATRLLWMTVLYQYALFTYEVLQHEVASQLSIKVDKVTEQQVVEKAERIQQGFTVKPSISSVFSTPDELVGCVVESFLEYSILFSDVQGNLFLQRPEVEQGVQKVRIFFPTETIDSFMERLRVSLSQFIDSTLPPVTTPLVGIQWITPELLYRIYQENDVNLTVAECKQFVLPMILQLLSMLHNGEEDQKHKLYKWITMFSGRQNIVLHSFTERKPELETMSKTMEMLFVEQKVLRQRHRFELPPLLQEEEQRLEKELESATDESTRIKLMNRITFLESYAQNETRTVATLPIVDPTIIASLLSPEELTYSDIEQCTILYELYGKRNELFFSEKQMESIVARMLDGLITRTHQIADQPAIAKAGKVFTRQTIALLLQTMHRYDTEHMFLFYSMLAKWLETPEHRLVIAHVKQVQFAVEVKEHLEWLHHIKLLESTTPLLLIFKSLFEEGKPVFHVSDNMMLDEYCPDSLPVWITKQVVQREKAFFEFQFPKEWFVSGQVQAPSFRILVHNYEKLMNIDIGSFADEQREAIQQVITPLRDELYTLLHRVKNQSLYQFVYELYVDMVQLHWYCGQPSDVRQNVPHPRENKAIYWMISYYLYGEMILTLHSLLQGFYLNNKEEMNASKPTIEKIKPVLDHLLTNYSYYFPQQNNSALLQLLVKQVQMILSQ